MWGGSWTGRPSFWSRYDLGWDPAGIKPKDAELLASMQEKELANGRVAMLGAVGFLLQEAITGDTWGAYWGF